MTPDNPFEVSEHCTGARRADFPFANAAVFRVEGDILVCGKNVVLPQVCALSLTTENLVAKIAMVQYGSFRLVFMQRTCSVTYYVRQGKKRGLPILNVFILVAAVCAAILLTAIFGDSRPFIAMVISIAVIVTVLNQWNKRNESIQLTLSRYESPGIYRVRGFSRQYLDMISSLMPFVD